MKKINSKPLLVFILLLSFYPICINAQTAPNTTTVNNMNVKGDMTVEDVTITKDTLRAKEDIIAEQDVKVSGDLALKGKIDFSNSGSSQISIAYKAATLSQNYASLNFGPPLNTNPAAMLNPESIAACFSLNNSNGQFNFGTQPQNNIFNGLIRSYNLNGTQSSMLTIGNTGWGSSMIESEGNYQNSTANTGLYINYFCGRDTYINTGNANGGGIAGGSVYMGDQVQLRKHVEIGHPTWFINDTTNTALDINAGAGKGIVFNVWAKSFPLLSVKNVNYTGSDLSLYAGGMAHFRENVQIGFPSTQSTTQDNTFLLNLNTNEFPNAKNGIKFATWNNNVKLIELINSNGGAGFIVYGSGKTCIGSQRVVGSHADAMLQVNGKTATKSLYVLKPDSWADYVFLSPKKEDLKKVEQFITQYHHLPDIQSEQEIMEVGYDVNTMDALLLSKIEKLYLHIIDQQKQIDALKEALKKTKN